MPEHGRNGTYTKHGCRCDACTDAHRAYQVQWLHADEARLSAHRERERARRNEQKPEPVKRPPRPRTSAARR